MRRGKRAYPQGRDCAGLSIAGWLGCGAAVETMLICPGIDSFLVSTAIMCELATIRDVVSRLTLYRASLA
jgi:hypothetical protein